MSQPSRREFVAGGLVTAGVSSAAAAQSGWRAGPVQHILPAASHNALLIKTSFSAPVRAPRLVVNGKAVPGRATDGGGRYWTFKATGLRADRAHELSIDAGAQGGTDAWSLRTTPAPDAQPERLRVLAFTCAGGDEDNISDGRRAFNPLTTRRALLQRGLDFQPDAVIAIGDHIYWDQETGLRRSAGAWPALNKRVGLFSPQVDDAENRRVLATIGDRQIAGLYGVSLRSTPVWFVRDDHDYFENDEFIDGRGTMPPSSFNRTLTEQIQAMFWPGFLPDRNRPSGLPAEAFGTLRWGRLFEALMYDCRGHLSASESAAYFVPPAAEAWIASRTRDRSIAHVAQTPSTPWGWSAGKWGEWYPDFLGGDGTLTTAKAKPGWRNGWFEQHQRLLSLAGSRGRNGVVLSGDLHAVGAARIERSGSVRPANEVHSILTGPLGTDDLAFPSAFRGTRPAPASGMVLEVSQEPLEKNGFTILDIERHSIRIRQFAWRGPTPVSAIARLDPILDKTVLART